jgi:pyrophosphatase PpaX
VALFDLDGTLIDSIQLIVDSYQHAFTTVLGHTGDEAEIRSWIGQPLIRAFRHIDEAHADELFAEYTAYNEANTPRMLKAFDGIGTVFDALDDAGVRYGIVTSKRTGPAHWGLELTGLTRVPVIIAQEDSSEHKPSPQPLLSACAKLGVEASTIVYIGDATVDIEAAHNAGAAGIAVTWGAGTREALAGVNPEVICDTVDELRAALTGATREGQA